MNDDPQDQGDRQARTSPPDLVPVLETSDATLLTVAKSVLEDAGIPFMVQGEYALLMLPLGPYGAGLRKHGITAIIHVAPEEAEKARALLSALPVADEGAGPKGF